VKSLDRFTMAALVAAALALCLGCGQDEGPSYLKNAGEAPPLSADQHSAAAAEDRAVAEEEQAEAAQYLPKSKGRSGR
jgi:predicted small lipoprotein YifL